ncbi:MAG: M50 family metallopeptidase [Bifidobacterium aquikefiri]|uniref:M50 family metallopeptidase n=1 Tax=Bifidobacterium aquikefiri TaxID=1653207 RepID=UPI0039EB7E6F
MESVYPKIRALLSRIMIHELAIGSDITATTNAVQQILHTIWTASLTPVVAPDQRLFILLLLCSILAIVITPIWGITRNAVTIAHEGGHAFAALLSGRKLNYIQLHSDTSGVTVSSGKSYGFGYALTCFAGYASPSLLGILCAWLTTKGYVTASLWILVVLLLLMLTRIRNGYGVLAVVVSIVIVAGISWSADADVRSSAAYILSWFMLLGGIRPLIELQAMRARGGGQGSDADQIARTTHIPGIVWILVWLIWNLAFLWLGATWMTQSFGGIHAVWVSLINLIPALQ